MASVPLKHISKAVEQHKEHIRQVNDGSPKTQLYKSWGRGWSMKSNAYPGNASAPHIDRFELYHYGTFIISASFSHDLVFNQGNGFSNSDRDAMNSVAVCFGQADRFKRKGSKIITIFE